MKQLYVRNSEKWQAYIDASHCLEPASVQTVDNAILLPLRLKENLQSKNREGVFEGGVCSADFDFVTGRQRSLTEKNNNFDVNSSYAVDEADLDIREEDVVFGGILVNHLGHTLLDASCRMWYLASHPEINKVVFLEYPIEFPSSFDCLKFVDLLGISRDRIEIIRKPTRFRSMVVPEEAIMLFTGYRPEFISTFDFIRSRIPQKDVDKLYLSRRMYEAQSASVMNEFYYEDFFRRRGFTIIYPEQLPLEDQIGYISGAKEIVSTVGTMTHLLLFADPAASVTILNRTQCIAAQMLLDEARGLSPVYIDATNNLLPVEHTYGPFLLMPNRFFKEYLDDAGVPYDSEELDFPESRKKELIEEFLEKWLAVYGKTANSMAKISQKTMFDVVKSVNECLNDKPFENVAVSDEIRNELSLLKVKNERLSKENKRLKDEIKGIRNSKSWKITAPLRALMSRKK